MPSSWRRDIVSVIKAQPILRAREAWRGSAKKNHTCAPLPDRDRSTAAGRPACLHVATNAATSSTGTKAWLEHLPHFTLGSSQTPRTNLLPQAGVYPAFPVFLLTKRTG